MKEQLQHLLKTVTLSDGSSQYMVTVQILEATQKAIQELRKVTFANKDELIKEAATLVNNKTMMKDANVKVEYNNAIKVLKSNNHSETEVKMKLIKLKNVQKDFVKENNCYKGFC